MNVLLYLASFGSLAALFASVVALIVWSFAKLTKALLEPDDKSADRLDRNRKPVYRPETFKRAGQ